MMRKNSLWVLTALLLSYGKLSAQVDAHFTQYYAYPQWLNPAFTGLMDGSVRVTGNYRKQWPSSNSAMTAQALSADISLPAGFAVGATIFNNKTAGGSYSYSAGYLSLSYQVHLSEYKILMAGFQAGLLNRRIDPNKFQFGNQYNPLQGYDETLPSNETFITGSATSVDGSVGILYFDGNPMKTVNPFIGISLYHPSEPDNHFISGQEGNKIPARYSAHGGLRIKMSGMVDILPNALYTIQGNANEFAAGLSLSLKIDATKDLIAGAMYRRNDAIAPNIGLHINGLMIGFSYDINTSQLKTASSVNGGYELSVSFTKQRKLSETKAIWPRL